jgi:hypothetical protein
MIEPPDADRLQSVTDTTVADCPPFAPVEIHRDPPRIDDIEAATHAAVADIPALDELPPGSEVGVGAGSRGIHDMPAVVAAIVAALQDRDLEPFVFPAMGSHGGATAGGQIETLASVGVTEDGVGCEIRSSMAVEVVGHDSEGRPIYAAEDVLAADAAVLANRVKLHTDFTGDIESGLAKMAVIGVGKQRGANAAHRAALEASFSEVIPERAAVLFAETPVVGGVALLENADERAAHIEGVPADAILDREPELLARARELQPMLPVEELDLLILDETGKDISGTGMDTNVVGRMDVYGEPEFETPDIVRVYVRSLTEATHGNANGIGLADFVHRDAAAAMDPGDTYVNSVTGGQPERGRLPPVVPDDETALLLSAATTGTADPADLRIARIRNTLEPDELLVAAPVAEQLRDREDATVGELRPLGVEDGQLVDDY